MKYAVIVSGNKQYRVQEGDTIEVERLSVPADTNYVFEKVLLVVDEGKMQLGEPLLNGIVVTAKVLRELKGQKIRVAKFKAKSRYRRVMGFRPIKTALKIEKIGKKTEKKNDA